MESDNEKVTCEFTKRAFWLDSERGQLFTWLYLPSTHVTNTGIVLCPPIGHEYVHCHRTYRHLAETLAEAGFTVIRFDYFGTGDSTGTMLESNLLDAWKSDVSAQLEFLHSFGHIEYTGVFGVRVGATIAFEVSESVQSEKNACDFCILWNPVVNGKRYVRELSAVSRMAVENEYSRNHFYEAGGFQITHELEDSLRELDLLADKELNTRNLLLLQNNSSKPVDDKLKAKLAQVENFGVEEVFGYDEMMHEPQFTVVPEQALSVIVPWLMNQSKAVQPGSSERGNSLFPKWSAEEFEEQVFENNSGLFAISCVPKNANIKELLVLVNSGSVHHVGPNRLYVELSRELAEVGIQVIRIDISNLGDSTQRGASAENDTYPQSAVDDVIKFTRELNVRFPGVHISLGGVCSGAYHSFHSAIQLSSTELHRILVINPLVFYWKPGMSLEIPTSYEVNKEAKYYEGSLKSWKSWKKLITGKVDYIYLFKFLLLYFSEKTKVMLNLLLVAAGLVEKSKLAQDISIIVEKGINVNFIFSSRDPGYGILKDEGGYTVRRYIRKKAVSIFEIPDADHTFSKSAYRKNLVGALRDALHI